MSDKERIINSIHLLFYKKLLAKNALNDPRSIKTIAESIASSVLTKLSNIPKNNIELARKVHTVLLHNEFKYENKYKIWIYHSLCRNCGVINTDCCIYNIKGTGRCIVC